VLVSGMTKEAKAILKELKAIRTLLNVMVKRTAPKPQAKKRSKFDPDGYSVRQYKDWQCGLSEADIKAIRPPE
jgi:hypothetical protein